MRAGKGGDNRKGGDHRKGGDIHDGEMHDELGVSSEISSSLSLTMSMNYVQLCFLHQHLSTLTASLTLSIFGISTLYCEPDRLHSQYELISS